MSVKLEIELDEPLLQRAEAWAERRGITLSSAVSTYLQELTREETPQPKSEWLKGLAGIGRATGRQLRIRDPDNDYVDHLEAKYS